MGKETWTSGGNLLFSADNGRMIKGRYDHAGMYLYEHKYGAGRETENCSREHLRALPWLLSFNVSWNTSHLQASLKGDETRSVNPYPDRLPALPRPHSPAPGVNRKAAGSGETAFILYPAGYTENPGICTETLQGSGWYQSFCGLWGILWPGFAGIVSHQRVNERDCSFFLWEKIKYILFPSNHNGHWKGSLIVGSLLPRSRVNCLVLLRAIVPGILPFPRRQLCHQAMVNKIRLTALL